MSVRIHRQIMNRIVTSISITLLLAASMMTGCGDNAPASNGPRGRRGPGGPGRRVDPGVPVSIHPIERGEIVSTVTFSATVESERRVVVYPQTSGLVRQIIAEEGDRVEAGQVLMVLDDDDARLAEAQARMDLRKAQTDSARNAELFRRNMISRESHEQIIYEVNRKRIAWQQAKLALDRTRIRTPAAGVIAIRDVEIGDRIGQSSTPYRVVTLSDLIAKVHVPGRTLHHIRVGQGAQITSDMRPDFEGRGRIKRISPVIDPESGTVKVTVDLPDPRRELTPGMFINVALITDRRDDALLLPKETLVYDGGQAYAFVVNDTLATRVALTLGLTNSRTVQVLEGAAEGDSIVIVGQEGLRDGAKVRVVDDAAAPIPPVEEPAADTSATADSTIASSTDTTVAAASASE